MIVNICLIVVIIITIYVLGAYNKLVKLNNSVNESESGIDVLLKQRYDLIPNIVECVKGYAKHENSTLDELAKLRSNYNNSEGFDIAKTEKMDKEFNRLIAVVEAYPELKANENFLALQRNLLEIEDELQDARSRYNRRVTRYNNSVETIPSQFVAKMFNFNKKDLFKANAKERENQKVSFE